MKHPLPVFLAAGAVLALLRAYGAPQAANSPAAEPARIVIEAARIERALAAHTRATGEVPGEEERNSIIAAEVRDQLLLHAALDMKLDRIDPRISWRLMEKMRFLGEADEDDAAATVRRARELGLAEHDVVIKRMLIEKMGTLARHQAQQQEFDAGELQAFFGEHRERWNLPRRTSLRHIFFPGLSDAAYQAAATALTEIQRSGRSRDREVSMGLPFVTGPRLEAANDTALAKLFGGGFSEAVGELPLGVWNEPLASAHGWHLVLVDQRQPARAARLEEVRGQVVAAFQAERGDRGLARLVEELQRRYEVSIEPLGGVRSAGGAEAGDGNA